MKYCLDEVEWLRRSENQIRWIILQKITRTLKHKKPLSLRNNKWYETKGHERCGYTLVEKTNEVRWKVLLRGKIALINAAGFYPEPYEYPRGCFSTIWLGAGRTSNTSLQIVVQIDLPSEKLHVLALCKFKPCNFPNGRVKVGDFAIGSCILF